VKEGLMNRRKFVTGSVGVAVGANVMRWARLGEAQVDKSKLSKTLGFASGGGAWQKALTDAALKPFEDELGVKIEQDSFGNEAEALAKLRAAGPGAYDVVAGNESGLYTGVRQGLFEPLSLENIPNYKNIVAALQKPLYDPGPGIHSIPDVYGANAIAYNTKYVEKPDSWGVCWDPKNKGRIAVRDVAIYRAFLTALYLKQDPNNITDVEQVYDAWRKQRPLVLKYYGATTEMQNLLANGEVWVGDFVGGRTLILQEQGAPLDYVIPKDGARGYVDCVAIAKGSPRKYTAEVLLNYMLEPKVANRISELTKYPHCLDPTKVPPSDAVKKCPDYDPSGTLSRFKFTNYEYMEKNRGAWEKAWTQIKVGG
jgi:spermidine/putrescine transport system substrate-binding protein